MVCVDKYVVLTEYTHHALAEMAHSLLRQHVIDAVIHSDDCGGMAGAQTCVRGIQILVHQKDCERARDILGIS